MKALARGLRSLLARLPQPLQRELFIELAGQLDGGPAEASKLISALSPAPVLSPAEWATHFSGYLQTHGAGAFNPELARLPRHEQAAVFEALTQTLDVRSAEAAGQNGALTGYLADGGVFLPYLRDRSWFWNGVEFIISRFAAGAGTFIDIGANIGAVVVPVAKACPGVHCLAFEPEPNNFMALAHNIARNGVSGNVTPHQVALMDADGHVNFELATDNFGDHRVRKTAAGTAMFNEGGRETVQLQAGRLDRITAGLKLERPLVIKMDVQGAELLVAAGGQETIRAADIVLAEYWPYGLRRLGGEPREFMACFAADFPFVARVGEGAITADGFMPTSEALGDLKTFAEAGGTMHLNLAFAKTRL